MSTQVGAMVSIIFYAFLIILYKPNKPSAALDLTDVLLFRLRHGSLFSLFRCEQSGTV